jgi:hypothetical protein
MRHPPFRSGGASGEDYSGFDGTTRLAAIVKAAWADVGVKLDVGVERVSGDRGGIPVFRLRFPPDFVNGLPPRRAIVEAPPTTPLRRRA